MENEEYCEFSWSGFFIVTACCSFLFNVALKFLDGQFSNMLFLIAGITAFLGSVNWLGRLLVKQGDKKAGRKALIS